jgi:hypothetical protein
MGDAGSGSGTEPQLSGQLVQLMERLKSGTHGGEPFELALTDEELEEALAWYSREHSSFPLVDAQISLGADGIEVKGEARVGATRMPLIARADVSVNEGVPAITVNEIQVGEMGLPDFIRFELEDQLNRFVALSRDRVPLLIDELELSDGQLAVRGTIR